MTDLLVRPHPAPHPPAPHPSLPPRSDPAPRQPLPHPAATRVRPRWHAVSVVVSWSVVAAAVVGAVHLGYAAPTVSPVAPPAAAVAPVADAPTPTTAGGATDAADPAPGRGPRRGGGHRRG